MFRYLRKSPYIWNSLIYGMSFVGAEIAQQIYQMKRVVFFIKQITDNK